ncbi:hypothetical protein [Aureimonas sp. N4]|uniref:hypothetical protein n=1 Tax=Aureimonas sp. N4 TaxID=1638165 RepID=UPI0007850D73|nr:hypothetical protein [Aureimonas sp. N4]
MTIHRIEEVDILFRVTIALALSVLTTGCATGVNRDLPRCNGVAKRPLNAGLWIPKDPKLASQMRNETGSKVLFDREPNEVMQQSASMTPYGPDMRPPFPALSPSDADLMATLSLEPC